MNIGIVGSVEKGCEIISTLERLMKGSNVYNLDGKRNDRIYYAEFSTINGCIIIKECSYPGDNLRVFTLEEFYKKYPYKIGDSVYIKGKTTKHTITKARWDGREVVYEVIDGNRYEKLSVNDITSLVAKETRKLFIRVGEIPEDEKTTIFNEGSDTEEYKEGVSVYNTVNIDGVFRIIMPIPAKKGQGLFYENEICGDKVQGVFLVEGDEIGIGPNNEPLIKNIKIIEDLTENFIDPLPKTYKECCEILGIEEDLSLVYENIDGKRINPDTISNYRIRRLKLQHIMDKLFICRDAYWHVYKNWKPDNNCPKYYISTNSGKVSIEKTVSKCEFLLCFPTERICQIFYKNFEELINEWISLAVA